MRLAAVLLPNDHRKDRSAINSFSCYTTAQNMPERLADIKEEWQVEYSWKPSFLGSLISSLPDDLQDQAEITASVFDKTIYAFSGSDVKEAVLVHGVSLTPQTANRIRTAVKKALPEGPWLPKAAVLQNSYMSNSMCPSGIVFQFEHRGDTYYSTSPAGEELGKGVASALLKYSATHERPASKIFGDLSTNDHTNVRSHVNRTAMLLHLLRKDSFIAELDRESGMGKPTVAEALERLREVGLVDFESVDTEVKGWGVYEKVGDISNIPHSPTLNRLRRNVIEYFNNNEKGNSDSIKEALGKVETGDISTVLVELTRGGFLRNQKWIGAIQQSSATIRDEGKVFVEEVLLPILYACAGNSEALRFLADIRSEIVANPSISSRAIEVYRDLTPRIPREKTKLEIVNLIRDGGALRTKDVLKTFGQKAEPVLRDMIEAGEIVRYRTGKASYHVLPGMEIPIHRDVSVQLEVVPLDPDKLVPLDARPKEEYRKDLDTIEFWRALMEDLNEIEAGRGTEMDFFVFYKPENEDWPERNDNKSGKYINLTHALRNLGYASPYSLIRDYEPTSEDPEFLLQVRNAQKLIKDKLIRTPYKRRSGEYLAYLDSEDFWLQLTKDAQAAPEGLTLYQFLAKFERNDPQNISMNTKGNYVGLYQALNNHTIDGFRTLLTHQPHNPTKKLTRRVNLARKIIREKFSVKRKVMHPEDAWEELSSEEFWDDFKCDLFKYTGTGSFYGFMYYFSESNVDTEIKKTSQGKSYLGKYNPFVSFVNKNFDELMQLPEFKDRSAMWPSDALASLIYHKAPSQVKDMLNILFPIEFGARQDEKDNQEEQFSIVEDMDTELANIALNSLFGLSSVQRELLRIYATWEKYDDELGIETVADELQLPSATIRSGIRKALDIKDFDSIWNRFVNLREVLEYQHKIRLLGKKPRRVRS